MTMMRAPNGIWAVKYEGQKTTVQKVIAFNTGGFPLVLGEYGLESADYDELISEEYGVKRATQGTGIPSGLRIPRPRPPRPHMRHANGNKSRVP